jgi:hypothetical protein
MSGNCRYQEIPNIFGVLKIIPVIGYNIKICGYRVSNIRYRVLARIQMTRFRTLLKMFCEVQNERLAIEINSDIALLGNID